MNPASALALAQFYVIDAVAGEVWYRVLPGDQWAGIKAQAVARISLPHLVGHEIVLRAPDGSLRAFSPSMIQHCPDASDGVPDQALPDLEALEDSHQ